MCNYSLFAQRVCKYPLFANRVCKYSLFANRVCEYPLFANWVYKCPLAGCFANRVCGYPLFANCLCYYPCLQTGCANISYLQTGCANASYSGASCANGALFSSCKESRSPHALSGIAYRTMLRYIVRNRNNTSAPLPQGVGSTQASTMPYFSTYLVMLSAFACLRYHKRCACCCRLSIPSTTA